MNLVLEKLKTNQNLIDDLNNQSFVQKNLMGVLKNIENTIPEESRENFYKNLETFRLSFDVNNGSSCSVDSTVINLDGKLAWLVENGVKGEMVNYEDELISEMYHEFLHLSSLTLAIDWENQQVRGVGGFSPVGIYEEGYIEKGEKYNGLTEGFTQLLTVENTGIKNTTNYDQQMNSAKKLINIVGMETVKKAYFDNRNGMKEIKDKLAEQSISPEFIDELEKECHIEHIEVVKNEKLDEMSIENNFKTR